MTADAKSPLEHVKDVVSQLKDMRHHAKNNVERLTAQWLMFSDGALKKLNQTDRIEALMTRQGELHDALVADIEAFEELVVELTPKEEDASASIPVQN